MIDKYDNIRCDNCGEYISYKSLEEGKSIHRLIYPDSDYSIETYESICYNCSKKLKELEKKWKEK